MSDKISLTDETIDRLADAIARSQEMRAAEREAEKELASQINAFFTVDRVSDLFDQIKVQRLAQPNGDVEILLPQSWVPILARKLFREGTYVFGYPARLAADIQLPQVVIA